ncbi:D-alanyl-D-alanine carboxypeptidase family protein [Acidocella sp.]|uniref:D-alanyl-D-alanine carboxypeptidase family protein n=1 Tax=Acidocella sp. TaxID=50710 RepID=UPI002623161B|nr:D-alanyl-D-alanine carboxypeptidase family protein [Acidocella sp.]
MHLWSNVRTAMLGLAGLGWASLVTAPAAFAYDKHHHHHTHHTLRPAAPAASLDNAGFGPTSPGVSSIVIDARTGQIFSAIDADTPRYPASLTKLMTLDLAFQALAAGKLSLDTRIPISAYAASVEPVKLGLRPGDTISVQDAILAMTTMSANDAATALGEYLGGGSEARCAQMMTLRAHALGMAQSQFANASGLPNPNQVTTARDLSLLARDLVINFSQFQSFFQVTSFNFRGRQIYSNNGMLKSYAGTTGMKTGYTNLARHNLITSAQRGGQKLIGVVLHEPSWGSAYQQMTAMLDGGFGGHVPMTPAMVVAANRPAKPSPAPAARPAPAPAVEKVASQTVQRARPLPGTASAGVSKLWAAQLGLYEYKTNARSAALKARALHGRGVAQIQHVQRKGKDFWLAQLTGLTYDGAHATCRAMNAHGRQCDVRSLASDHLAMAAEPDGT